MIGVWIDASDDDPQERYGQRLRAWSHAFAAASGEPQAGGITLDALHYAVAAWDSSVSKPPYVRFNPRVLDATCHRWEDTYIALAAVELAAPPQVRIPDGWLGWQQDKSGFPCMAPPYNQKAALCTLELRTPISADRLPTPTRPEADGLPNLADAQAALEALIQEINTVVVPFLLVLEGNTDQAQTQIEIEIEIDKTDFEEAEAVFLAIRARSTSMAGPQLRFWN
ncbi:hypothetical protein [Microtetraspora fusca]|uniref:hypothetical protein n=1 Tax=Microtetraspora fusca TaxID=1997 RepID=UPI00082FDF2D|nr:hypothetical protein [Microtetraspora fusca]